MGGVVAGGDGPHRRADGHRRGSVGAGGRYVGLGGEAEVGLLAGVDGLVGGAAAAAELLVVEEVVLQRLGEVHVDAREDLAAAPEVEAVDAGAQVGAVGFGAGEREHAEAGLACPPAHAW